MITLDQMERMRIWAKIVTVETGRRDNARNVTEMASAGLGNWSDVRGGKGRNPGCLRF